MWFLGHFPNELRVKGHAAFVPANFGQQPIIESFASTKPATGKIKGYARRENEVQLV